MALVLPVFVVISMGCIDAGRYVYITAQLTANSRAAARLAALPTGETSDCSVLAAAASVGGGFIAPTQDPNSVWNSTASSQAAATTPSSGHGLIWIYPAVAAGSSPPWPTAPLSCDATSGNSRVTQVSGNPPSVTVRITYAFQPVTPVAGPLVQKMTITVSSTQPTGY